ncbi:MAG: acetylornithine transaminase [Candidatus Nanopelagicales bacterium]|nr:acetylornithine transaminase [Candidatus Nanopelagicales bacterium]
MNNFNWDKFFLNNYGTPKIELVEGEGVVVKDSQGNIYLDFLSGIAVNSLGHAHPVIIEAVNKQISQLSHTSNFYANKPALDLAEKLIEISGLDAKVFFCNSGAEANEAALKLTRRTGKKKLLSANGSFHGRTIGALSITGQLAKQKPFKPLLSGIKFIDINTKSAVRKIKRNTAAIFLESIQGEGGVVPCSDEFLTNIRQKTLKTKTLMIMDEVQTGMGRTGNWFGYEQSKIKPDVITLAKGLGAGLPMGALLVAGDAKDLFEPGQHGSTFGGNPVVASAALATIKFIEKENLLMNVTNMGKLLGELLGQVQGVKEVRGRGLLLGVCLDNLSAKDVEAECKNLGLLINAVTDDTLRIAPAFIVNIEQVQRCAEIIEDAIKNVSKLVQQK